MPAFCGLAALTDAEAAPPLIAVEATARAATVSVETKIPDGDRRPDRTALALLRVFTRHRPASMTSPSRIRYGAPLARANSSATSNTARQETTQSLSR